jgi:HSP20 family protein
VEKKSESTIPSRTFLPITDIFETDQALTVILEMPGVDKENVDVNVENDIPDDRGPDRLFQIRRTPAGLH